MVSKLDLLLRFSGICSSESIVGKKDQQLEGFKVLFSDLGVCAIDLSDDIN
jgi:hypothetical protein